MCDATTSLNDFLRSDLCGKRVLSFLTAKDALSYATTSKTNRAASCLGILDPMPLAPGRGSSRGGTVHWDMSSNYHHGDDPVFYKEICIPILNCTHSVIISCTWKDQGWGNRKGKLYILGCEDISNSFNRDDIICQTSDVAEHEWRPLRLVFQPEEGKRYFLWYSVGGGGGHQLFVKDLKQHALIYDDFGSYIVRQHRALLSKGAFDNNPLVSLLLKSVAAYAQRSFTADGACMDESIFGALEALGLSPSNKEAMDALVVLASSMHGTMSSMAEVVDDQGSSEDDDHDSDYMQDYLEDFEDEDGWYYR